jgi:hypothetical protein
LSVFFSIAEKIANILLFGAIYLFFTVLLPKKNARAKKKETRNLILRKFSIIYNFHIVFGAFFWHSYLREYSLIDFLEISFLNLCRFLGFLIFASAFTSIHTFMENIIFS